MSTATSIEWADVTWSPLIGCDRVSPGCDNCYAITTARMRSSHPNPKVADAFAGTVQHYAGGRLDWSGQVNLLPDRLSEPLRWHKPRKVFVNSMSDLFHDNVPDEFIARVFGAMAATPRHTFQVLTKRHARMRSLLSTETFRTAVADAAARWLAGHERPGIDRGRPWDLWPLPNLWLGVSVEDQLRAELRIRALLQTPAAVRFLSCEPMLGSIDLMNVAAGRSNAVIDVLQGDVKTAAGEVYAAAPSAIDWVIVGGESGRQARPMNPAWARALRDQCQQARVPFFFKQWGEHIPVPVFDEPDFSGGRAFRDPRGGTTAAVIRDRSTKAFRSGDVRAMRAGDRNGFGVMLDDDTLAMRVGKTAAGRELDGRTWDEFPTTHPNRTDHG